jgi:hypothetical protein
MSQPSLQALEATYPTIAWREPVKVVMQEGSGLGCRVCIAQRGLRGDEPERLFVTRADYDAHFAQSHAP